MRNGSFWGVKERKEWMDEWEMGGPFFWGNVCWVEWMEGLIWIFSISLFF